ncbi:hypothetical protein QFC21_003305 [Naganishia friedmannii]|uniref:Uncharacterized protein n=1 Tax=Naganishia friedmannii TaxID=89922 RepID=A0ACC2VRK7_9TREE|nr:hypothetical protein QFC21_003305 [Naganishia friedmannii]
MADSALIIAIVSLVASFLATFLASLTAGGVSLYSEERRRRLETGKLISRYRDPLFLASSDLLERLETVIRRKLVGLAPQQGDAFQRDTLFIFTSFVIGQYLSWVWILRRQIQYLRYQTGRQDQALTEKLREITHCLFTDKILVPTDKTCAPFMLYRGYQLAIGEIMSVREPDGSLVCMGYASFVEKYNDVQDATFRGWFQPIEKGIYALIEAEDSGRPRPHERLHELQGHLTQLQRLLLDQV